MRVICLLPLFCPLPYLHVIPVVPLWASVVPHVQGLGQQRCKGDLEGLDCWEK